MLKFFVLSIDDNKEASQGLIDQCKHVLSQYNEIAIEKPMSQMEGLKAQPKKEFTESDVFQNVNEFYAF